MTATKRERLLRRIANAEKALAHKREVVAGRQGREVLLSVQAGSNASLFASNLKFFARWRNWRPCPLDNFDIP